MRFQYYSGVPLEHYRHAVDKHTFDSTRLRQVNATKDRLHAYISSQANLSEEYKKALLTVVDEVVKVATQEEAAHIVYRLFNERIGGCMTSLLYRIKDGPLGSTGEASDVGSGTFFRTTRRRRTQSAFTFAGLRRKPQKE